MTRFKIPPVSPLVGATPGLFLRIVRSGRVAPRLRYKVINTSFLVALSSLFQWLDPLYFSRKLKTMAPKDPPLFIIGHWRSGTTLMHNLLSGDPQFGYVSTYHSVFPSNLRVKPLYNLFLNPFMPIERPGDGVLITMDVPQEDEYSISNLTPLSFYHFFYFPSQNMELYMKSVRFEGISEDQKKKWKDRYRKITSKSLIETGGSRALIKNPVHTGRLEMLNQIYPDAQYIFMIRNPVKVYLSTMNFMHELFQTTALEEYTYEQLSEIILENYQHFLQDYIRTKDLIDPERILEVRFEDLRADPVQRLEQVYRQFSMQGFEKVSEGFTSHARSERAHRMNTYTLSEGELERVLAKLDFAMKHWNYKAPTDLKIQNGKHMKSA
jgi:hypothetical protein